MRLVCVTVILSALLFSLAGCKSSNTANTGARTSPAAQKAAMDQQLIEAAISGDAARVKALLDQGANPNARDADGRNPKPLTAPKDVAIVGTLIVELAVTLTALANPVTAAGRETPLRAKTFRRLPLACWKVTDLMVLA